MSEETQQLIDAVFRELAEQAEGEPNGHPCTALPLLEAECAWVETGLVWEGYSHRDMRTISRAVAAQVALSLAIGGYLLPQPAATIERQLREKIESDIIALAPYNCELLYDGREDHQTAAWVEGIKVAARVARGETT